MPVFVVFKFKAPGFSSLWGSSFKVKGL